MQSRFLQRLIALLSTLTLFSPALCFASTTSPSASSAPIQGKRASEDPIAKSIALAGQLRSKGALPLAEAADDAAWDLQVRAASAAATKTSKDELVNTLWRQVSIPYLQRRITPAPGAEAGSRYQAVSSLDASYVAGKAALLVRCVLTNDYKTGLLTANSNQIAPARAAISFDDPAAQRARLLLREIGDSVAASINGLTVIPADEQYATREPTAAIVYAVACEPLAQPCLLDPDQIETFVRAQLETAILPNGCGVSLGNARAVKLLTFLKEQYPAYVRMKQVNALMVALAPQAAGGTAN